MCDEKVYVKKEEKYYDVFSVDGSDVILDTSEFDADALYNETNNNEPYEVVNERNEASSNSWNVEKKPDLGRINPTTHLRKAKR